MPNKISIWWRAVRPFAFPVSTLPPILGTLTALMGVPELRVNWLHFLLATIGCLLAHSGANLLSDYYDYRNGVDRSGTFGSSGVLVEGLMTPRQVWVEAMITFALAAAIGMYFILTLEKGIVLFWIVFLGGLLGFFYTTGPIKLKYRAFGDIAVFIAFGPAMSLGAYFVQAQRFSWKPIWVVLPLAFLVDAVLHGNNLRDIDNDRQAGIRTVAMLLGEKGAEYMYITLLAAAYVTTAGLILFGELPWQSSIVGVSIPLAGRLIQLFKGRKQGEREPFNMIDARTAQFHFAFGLLLIASLIWDFLAR